jgi:SAM-dependent methyltransferase
MKKRDSKYKSIHSQLDLPFLETKDEDLNEIFKILESKFGLSWGSTQRFIDLGSGNGIVIIHVALHYNIQVAGIEINKELVRETKIKIENIKQSGDKKLLDQIKVLCDDFYNHSIQDFDFIYIFSLPTMQRFLKHVFKTAKQGAVIISYKYPLNDLDDILTQVHNLEIDNDKSISAYFYRKN